MRYYIDGYNVTKSDPATRALSIEEQRDALESRLRLSASRILGKVAYTIVWDGAGGLTRPCRFPNESEAQAHPSVMLVHAAGKKEKAGSTT